MQASAGLVAVLSGGQFGLFLANCLTPRGAGAVKAGRRPPRSGLALTVRSPAGQFGSEGQHVHLVGTTAVMKAVLVFFPFLRVRVGVGSKRSCGEAVVVTRRLRDRFTMTAGRAAVGRT